MCARIHPKARWASSSTSPRRTSSFPTCWCKLDVIPAADRIQLPPRAGGVKVLKGGPVETGRGFVLHSRRFLHREFDAADRRRHLPHRDARHPQGDRARQGPGKRDPGARLCRLGAGPARERDPAERLAALRGRSRADLRHRHRRANTTRRCARSASIPACCRATPATPDGSCHVPIAAAMAGGGSACAAQCRAMRRSLR